MRDEYVSTPRTKDLKVRIKGLMKSDFTLENQITIVPEDIKTLVRDIIALSVQNMAHWHIIMLSDEDAILCEILGV